MIIHLEWYVIRDQFVYHNNNLIQLNRLYKHFHWDGNDFEWRSQTGARPCFLLFNVLCWAIRLWNQCGRPNLKILRNIESIGLCLDKAKIAQPSWSSQTGLREIFKFTPITFLIPKRFSYWKDKCSTFQTRYFEEILTRIFDSQKKWKLEKQLFVSLLSKPREIGNSYAVNRRAMHSCSKQSPFQPIGHNLLEWVVLKKSTARAIHGRNQLSQYRVWGYFLDKKTRCNSSLARI